MEEKNVIKYSIDLTFPELLTVIKGLKKLPYEESAAAIGNIQNQYDAELKKREEAAKKAREKEVAKE